MPLNRHNAALAAAWLGLLLVVAAKYAEPFLDGDLFWHMAYAKQMLVRGTLVLDHTAFSWTPAANTIIYCAWAAELALYWLWEHLGPWSLFALRYLVVVAVLALAADYARRAGLGRTLFVPMLLILLALTSHLGTIIKPELFSLLFFHLVLWIYFRAKLDRANGVASAARFYVVPAIVLLWVNHHGGFVLVAPLLAATAIGEVMNARLSPAFAFTPRARRHLVTAWALCAVAITITPYGVHYPVQLFQDYVLGATARPDVAWNAAHRAVFNPAVLSLHLAEYAVMLGALLGFLFVLTAKTRVKGARVDWAVVLVNAAYLALFLGPLRSAYLWPAVVVYSTLYLLRAGPGARATTPAVWMTSTSAGQMLTSLAVGLMIFAGARGVYEARYRPLDRSWMGFGIGDTNPVAEAEFLANAGLGPRLYNIFDSGGYLLWRLDPTYKVMTDQRSFPYLSWFDDQYRFTLGTSFDEFLSKYPADVALIDLAKEGTTDNFLRAPDWRLVYYGMSAAVFVREGTEVPDAALAIAPDRFDVIRSPSTALRVFDFARRIGDRPTALRVLAQMETRHRRNLDAAFLTRTRQEMGR